MFFKKNPNTKETILSAALMDGRQSFYYAAGFSLVTNLLFLALPIYTNQVFGRVLLSHSMSTLVVLTLGAIFVFAVLGALDYLRSRILAQFGTVLDQRVSGHVFTALFDGVVRREPAAGAQALRDLDNFRQAITGPTVGVIFDLPWMPIYLLILFIIDPYIGVLTLLGMVTLAILAIVQDRASRPASKEANNAAIKSYAFAEASLRNAEVVRAMGMLPNLGRQWSVDRVRAIGQGLIASQHAEFWGDAIKFVRMVIQILIIALGALLIIEGKIGGGMLFANMILSSRALAPIERAVASWGSLIAASQAYERLNGLMADYAPASPATALPTPRGDLMVEGVTLMSPDGARLILTGLTFHLPAGQFLGLIGPSGAGKSSLVRLLVGVWKPVSGVVRLDGANVFTWARTEFGRHVGYLPQDTELFSGTVRDNIARFLPDVTDDEVIAAARTAGAHDLIIRLPKGYDTELGASGVVLSVGQRQRVGLARALLRDPAFVVLDEPNANLDAEGEAALSRALDTMKKRGATIVVVSHKPSLLQHADRLMVLRDGKLDVYGPRQVVLDQLAQQGKAVPVSRPVPAPAAPSAVEGKS